MVKVLDPDGVVLAVYETGEQVPARVPNRFCSYFYPKEELKIVEVTDPKDQRRLQKTLEACLRELGE